MDILAIYGLCMVLRLSAAIICILWPLIWLGVPMVDGGLFHNVRKRLQD